MVSNLCKYVVSKLSNCCQIMVQKMENQTTKSVKDNWPERPRVFLYLMTPKKMMLDLSGCKTRKTP